MTGDSLELVGGFWTVNVPLCTCLSDINNDDVVDQRDFEENWQNAWGGLRGSMADGDMRKNRESAAEDIADEIIRRLYPEP